MTSRNFFGTIVVLLTGGAVIHQMQRPPEKRTWYGRVAGVPYDFRPPTLERTMEKIWNEENPSLMAPTLWGVGWFFNLYRLAHPFES